jgi:hypothetical protein
MDRVADTRYMLWGTCSVASMVWCVLGIMVGGYGCRLFGRPTQRLVQDAAWLEFV